MEDFVFLPADGMSDGEITLDLQHTRPAVPEKGFVPCYDFFICNAASGERVGTMRLRVGDNENVYYGGHIGYEVYPAHRGHHYAAKACRVVFDLMRRHGMDHAIITVNPDNGPSRRTCELLGAELLEVVDIPSTQEMYLEGERQKCRYRVNL